MAAILAAIFIAASESLAVNRVVVGPKLKVKMFAEIS